MKNQYSCGSQPVKRLKYGMAFLALVGIGFVSCEKEETVQVQNFTNTIEQTRAQDIVIIECTPHRNSKECENGWGLCDCEFLPNAPWKTAINTDLDELNNEMTLESHSFVNNGYDTLFVELNLDIDSIWAQAYGYSKITILSGAYLKNSNQSVTVDVQLTQ